MVQLLRSGFGPSGEIHVPMPTPRKRKGAGSELLIPIAALLFTLYYFWTIWNSPWTAQVSAFFIGTILILLVLVFTLKTAVALYRGEAHLRIGELLAPRSLLPMRIGLLLMTLGYVILVKWGGFTLTTWVFLCGAMLILNGGRRKRLVALLSAALALSGYLLFVVAFETRFPRGPFENLMRSIF
jgi:hypothetical protein